MRISLGNKGDTDGMKFVWDSDGRIITLSESKTNGEEKTAEMHPNNPYLDASFLCMLIGTQSELNGRV